MLCTYFQGMSTPYSEIRCWYRKEQLSGTSYASQMVKLNHRLKTHNGIGHSTINKLLHYLLKHW